MNDEQQTIHPPRAWYAIGALLFFVGIIGAPGWFIVTLVSAFTSGDYFLAPCSKIVTINDPGKYVLWHAAKTFFQGRNYASPPELPDGVIIKVVDTDTKEELAIESAQGSTESSGNNKKYSICSFWVKTPGSYTIEIRNLPSNHVFMIRKALAKRILLALLKCGVIGFIGGIGGTILIVFVAVRRHKAKKRDTIFSYHRDET